MSQHDQLLASERFFSPVVLLKQTVSYYIISTMINHRNMSHDSTMIVIYYINSNNI